MPAKPAPIKKSAKKAAPKVEKPAEPEPAPEAPPAEAPPAEAPLAEAAPAEAAPAEAAPAEAAPAAEAEAPPAAPEGEAPPPEAEPAAEAPAAPAAPEAAPPAEAAAPAVEEAAPPAEAEAPAEAAAPAAEEPAAPAAPAAPEAEAPAEAAPAAEEAAAPAAPEAEAPVEAAAEAPAAEEAAAPAPAEGEAPAEAPAAPAAEEPAAPAADAEAPTDAAAAAPAAEEGAAPDAEAPAEAAPAADAAAPAEAPAEAAPAEAPPAEEPPKAPTPPPPPEPTSAPLNLTVDDVNDTTLTIKWRPPEAIGDSGLDGYTVEYCKDGATEWVVANAELTVANRFVINELTTGDLLNVRVVAVNAGGRSEPAALAEPVPIREVVDRPKIRLPRSLRTRFVKQVGEQINLVIPYSGKPKPVVTWSKDGQPVDPKRVNVRNSDKDSILFIRKSERDDSGIYEMTVKVDSFEDKATLIIQIVELPGPPASVKMVDSWGFNAALEWTPPKDNGNTEITGYTVQKADRKTGDWFTVLEHYHRLNATISDLIMGNSYSFRVFALNKVGMSESAAVTKEVATIQKTGIVYKPPEYKEHDFSEAPKFTTSLNDRAATVGYTTKLLCSVRGSPKPKIEWLKNQMIIGDDPKFRQLSNQGVCSLEIRKPCSFDGGVYTCRAKNAHGEATVACKLEVRQVIVPEGKDKK